MSAEAIGLTAAGVVVGVVTSPLWLPPLAATVVVGGAVIVVGAAAAAVVLVPAAAIGGAAYGVAKGGKFAAHKIQDHRHRHRDPQHRKPHHHDHSNNPAQMGSIHRKLHDLKSKIKSHKKDKPVTMNMVDPGGLDLPILSYYPSPSRTSGTLFAQANSFESQNVLGNDQPAETIKLVAK